MKPKEKIEMRENPREVFGQALAGATPSIIRDCFGPIVEQWGWVVFLAQKRQPPVSPEKKQKK